LITGTVGLRNHPVAGNVRERELSNARIKKAGARAPREYFVPLREGRLETTIRLSFY